MSTGVPIENFSCFCDSLEFLLGVSVVVVHRCEEVPFEILPYAADGPVVVMDPGAAGLLLDKRGGSHSRSFSRSFASFSAGSFAWLIPYYEPNGKDMYLDVDELVSWQKKNHFEPIMDS